MGAQRVNSERNSAKWKLNQRTALKLFLNGETWQIADAKIARHALLNTFDTPELNGIFQGNGALAQRAFKNLPKYALWLIDNKAQRICCPQRVKSTAGCCGEATSVSGCWPKLVMVNVSSLPTR